MFYDTEKNDHGLEYNPFKSLVVPRAIGWLSTLSPEGGRQSRSFQPVDNAKF